MMGLLAVPLALTLLAALDAPVPPPADVAPAPAPSVDSLAYDDPGMHFRAPDGWVRINLAPASGGSNEGRPPAAVFAFHRGESDQRTIIIEIQPFDGTLEGFESSHETELRNQAEGTFIDHKSKTALSNGMPAYFIKVSQPGGPVGHQLRRYDYVVYDLQRSIDVAYIGRYGDFDEAEAQKALSSLYVVVYPRHRS